ncbi:MAG: tRNA (guanine(46)-N(7))-methyltransferase TrmB [Pseudomonadota bacterium]
MHANQCKSPVTSQSRFYGRRTARPLRPAARLRMQAMMPSLALPLSTRFDSPKTLFPNPAHALRVEIGYGAGEYLARQAEQYPDTGFIGIEPFADGQARLLALIEAKKLCNIRLFNHMAQDLLPHLPAFCLDQIDINYPDPWPKTRHHRRRLIQPDMIATFAHLLKPGGLLQIVTDHQGYAHWILQLMDRAHQWFDWLAWQPTDWQTPPADWIQTRYETKALTQGLKPFYLRYRRTKAPGAGFA